MTELTIVQIPETVVEGKRLGRHVQHDPRSLAYVLPESTPVTVRWERAIPVLDQGNLGSCTGNAATGHLGTAPDYATLAGALGTGLVLDEAEAVKLYSAAEVLDGGAGYPPQDDGSSGLSVARAAKNASLISGYVHMTSVAACHTAIQTGPFIVGTNWYTSMDSPDANGLVGVSGSVRGGHEYECIGYDAGTDLWEFVNSWGTGYGVAGHFFYSSSDFARLLSEQGDATQFVPLSQPAPVPTPPVPVPVPVPTPPSPEPVPTPTPVPPEPTPVPVPVPPVPNPTPTPDPALLLETFLASIPAGWENHHHAGWNEQVADAIQALRAALG